MKRKLWMGGLLAAFVVFSWAGCSKDSSSALPTGSVGESCQRRADCDSGLNCIGQVCTMSSTPPDAGGSPLGGEGESCTKRADCEAGLVCIGNVCRMDADASAGGVGETCGARSDCAEGLGCVRNECVPADEPGPGGSRGESCFSSADCAEPLICRGLTCVEGDWDIEATDNECLRVECTVPADCCPEPYTLCEEWKDACEMGAGGAPPIECTNYENPIYNCICDDTVWGCEDFACTARVPCDTDLDCTFGVCSSGECVACAVDDDCTVVGQRCIENTCMGACESDTQCPVFHICDQGACVETGCGDDRECVAYLNNARALCVEGACQTPCDRDSDCLPNPVPQTFAFAACIDGACQDLGCKTKEECKIRLNLAGNTLYEAECLPKDR